MPSLFALNTWIQCYCIYSVRCSSVQVEIYTFVSITLDVQFLPQHREAVKAPGISPALRFTCQDILSTRIMLLSHSQGHATNERCCVLMRTLKSPTYIAALETTSQKCSQADLDVTHTHTHTTWNHMYLRAFFDCFCTRTVKMYSLNVCGHYVWTKWAILNVFALKWVWLGLKEGCQI